MSLNPKEKYIFTFLKDENGNDVKYRFMLTLSKKLSERIGEEMIGQRLMKSLAATPGIDGITPNVGQYTIEVVIARTFDPDEVIEVIKDDLDKLVLSEIIRPRLVTP